MTKRLRYKQGYDVQHYHGGEIDQVLHSAIYNLSSTALSKLREIKAHMPIEMKWTVAQDGHNIDVLLEVVYNDAEVKYGPTK